MHKLSLERLHHQSPTDSDRGHITTILEHDDGKHPLADRPQPSFIDTARSMLDEYATSQELANADSMSSQRNLPRVKTSRTADHAVQVAIAGDRQNSLPDLTSRRALRPRAAALRKNSIGPVRLDSQVRGSLSLKICLLVISFSLHVHLSSAISELILTPRHSVVVGAAWLLIDAVLLTDAVPTCTVVAWVPCCQAKCFTPRLQHPQAVV